MQPSETAGSEIWMDDVTGDGIGDLIIGRQSFTTSLGLVGAGAVALASGPGLRAHAATLRYLDLSAPPAHHGDHDHRSASGGSPRLDANRRRHRRRRPRPAGRRRSGGVDGNRHAGCPISSVAARIWLPAADRSRRARYAAGIAIALLPPRNAAEFHVGATCQIADLDSNGRGEVLLAAALSRAGASSGGALAASHAVGGTTTGTLYILWDDNR
jgi:hypothetical protein